MGKSYLARRWEGKLPLGCHCAGNDGRFVIVELAGARC